MISELYEYEIYEYRALIAIKLNVDIRKARKAQTLRALFLSGADASG
ncbi:hypothetical protein P353_02925 [Comamonas testosteroni]|uniref:Uncharacterized protein n=1 Tax=Comamonas testosteroni TaxID=285 RepID=A0A096HTW7_COMTE|nr:hypothetical protein P353_02925 [Comamonas testosteroni]